MKRRIFFHKKHRTPPRSNLGSTLYALDKFTPQNIKEWTRQKDGVLQVEWELHNEVALQRSKIIDELKSALSESTEQNFKFQRWQRVVPIKWSLEPLSAKGSVKGPSGSRFNIGNIDPVRYPTFPALYLAEGRATALQEHSCQTMPNQKLTSMEFALSKKTSISCFSVSGSLNEIINLHNKKTLKKFVSLIKAFDVSDRLKKLYKMLYGEEIQLVRNEKMLLNVLLDPNWRKNPIQFDVPAGPQIFGQLVKEAGIEGILYPSKFTKKSCLAIYPTNLKKSNSKVFLDDTPPSQSVIKELNSETYKQLS